jgi:hypothetical protein
VEMAGLRAQGDIDEHLIAELEAQAVIDRAEIANLKVALRTARPSALRSASSWRLQGHRGPGVTTLRIAS